MSTLSDAWRDIGGGIIPFPKARRAANKTPWREGDIISNQWIDDGHAYRKKNGLPRINLDIEAERFVNRQLATGARYTIWHRAWLNWCISPYCAGAPEREPVHHAPTVDHDEKLLSLALRGVRGTWFGPDLVRRGIQKGIITQEQARKLGF